MLPEGVLKLPYASCVAEATGNGRPAASTRRGQHVLTHSGYRAARISEHRKCGPAPKRHTVGHSGVIPEHWRSRTLRAYELAVDGLPRVPRFLRSMRVIARPISGSAIHAPSPRTIALAATPSERNAAMQAWFRSAIRRESVPAASAATRPVRNTFSQSDLATA